MATVRKRVRERLMSVAPWRADVPWQISAVQGVLALGLGVYFLFASGHAAGTLSQIVGAYIAGVSLLQIIAAVRDPGGLAARPSGLLRRVIGLLGGAAAMLYPWIDWLSAQDARLIVTAILIASGIITIAGAFSDRRLTEIRWGTSLGGVVEIVIGAVFFIITDYDRPLMNLMGITLLVAGLALATRAVWVSGFLKSMTRDE
jgi:uncharacterized membrane protein HdeD (DUF308 family)